MGHLKSWLGLVGSGGGAAGFDFAEGPDQEYAEEAEQCGPSEDIDECPEQGLAAQLLVNLPLRGCCGVGSTGLVAKVGLQLLHPVLERIAAYGQVIEYLILVVVGAAGQFRLRHRYTDGPADVPQQVENAAGIAYLFIRKGAVGLGRNRHKDEAESETRGDDRPEKRGWADAQIDIGEEQRADGKPGKSQGQEDARIDLVAQVGDYRHTDNRTDSARAHDQTGGERRVPEQFLVEEWQDGDGRIQCAAEHENEAAADSKVPVLQDAQVDQRIFGGERPVKERAQSRDQEERDPAEPVRAEPVIFLTLVQQDLKAAGPDGEQTETDAVKWPDLGVFNVWRVVHEAIDHENCQDADRDIDVKRIAPAVTVGQPAAEGRSQDGCDDNAEGKESHGRAPLGGRKALEQDRLRKWLQCATASALDHPGDEHDAERRCRAAEERRDCEDGDTCDQEALPAEFEGGPVGRRQDDRIRHQVAGKHPGRLVI